MYKMYFHPGDTLIVVDMQNDFIPPHGAFGVKHGDEIEQAISTTVYSAIQHKTRVIFTQDWHPKDHMSFDTLGKHCVQNTRGAELCDVLFNTYTDLKDKGQDVHLVKKAFNKHTDSYSAIPYTDKEYFKERFNDHGNIEDTGAFVDPVTRQGPITGLIRPGRIWICGLAEDFCVLDTAICARDMYPHTHVTILKHLTRCVNEEPLHMYRKKRIELFPNVSWFVNYLRSTGHPFVDVEYFLKSIRRQDVPDDLKGILKY